MRKAKTFTSVRFTPEALKAGNAVFLESIEKKPKKLSDYLSVEVKEADWLHDNEEEFFADVRLGNYSYAYDKTFYINEDFNSCELSVRFSSFTGNTTLSVKAPSRAIIEKVFSVFEERAPNCQLPEKKKLKHKMTIFIGHGRDESWRILQTELQDKHEYKVIAYEIGARAGHTIRDILDEMLSKSSIAFLVMTGEDTTAEGKMRPRQNVVHEAGLFQGKLGFNKGIIVLEEGIEEFSNLAGIQYIPFSKGNIKSTMSEILATIRREEKLIF